MRDNVGRERVKGLSLVGHEEVPRGFGLITGDPSDTADGDGDCRRPAQPNTGGTQSQVKLWTSISFPEIRYPGLA